MIEDSKTKIDDNGDESIHLMEVFSRLEEAKSQIEGSRYSQELEAILFLQEVIKEQVKK
ncbi:MAG: hypothetical protein KDD25_04395 [Bdellovibrionales bacterium]|nr:hypothetical protein [Bdellovibrionales bacterium]